MRVALHELSRGGILDGAADESECFLRDLGLVRRDLFLSRRQAHMLMLCGITDGSMKV